MHNEYLAAMDEEFAGQQHVPNLMSPNMDGLSYGEYFEKVKETIEQMRQNWKLEQRVKTLKVVIQLTKLLADTSQMKLYPRKHKLITEALDEFGRLVYIRIHSIATTSRDKCSSDTQSSSSKPVVSEEVDPRELAKDICRNWFLKIASIRELVPRFYIELAILKTCDILFNSASSSLADSIGEQFYAQTLRRLTRTAWGFGNPIVALHARAYLCSITERLIGWHGATREAIAFGIITANLRCSTTFVCRLETITPIIGACNGSPSGTDICIYFDLISSPIQSILSVITVRYDEITDELEFVNDANERLRQVVEELVDEELKLGAIGTFKRNILLHSLVKAIPDDIVASLARKFMDKFVEGYNEWRSSVDSVDRPASSPARTSRGYERMSIVPTIYTTLGSFMIALDGCDSFEEAHDDSTKVSILNEADKLISELLTEEANRISVAYLRCFKAVLSYANHYCESSVDKLLTTFIEHIKRGRQYVEHYLTLLDIIKTLFTSKTQIDDFKRIFMSKAFCQLFDLLRKDEHILDASKWTLETMRANIKLNYKTQVVTISDRTIINFLLKLFASINDSLSPLTAPDDTRHLSDLVIFFLDIITIDDITERLELYSRCRKNVCNLNHVLKYLISAVLRQPDEYRKVEKKRSLRHNFLNGCLAFAYATTPALNDMQSQLDLYLDGCQLALTHMSLSLADYFMKQIIQSLTELLNSKQSKYPLDDHQAFERRPVVTNGALVERVESIVSMVVRHQDYVDLKHKLTLTTMIRESSLFSENSKLLETLKQLDLVVDEIYDAGFNNNDINNDIEMA